MAEFLGCIGWLFAIALALMIPVWLWSIHPILGIIAVIVIWLRW